MFSASNIFTIKPSIKIDDNADIVFVADLFADDYQGGAELTTEALIQSSPFQIYKLKSKDVSLELLKQGHKKYWIFGNFSQLNPDLIPTIISNLSYSILEYDYKFCKFRSPEKHVIATQQECDCHQQISGKMISAFMYGAKSLWWMSEKQQAKYFSMFPFLAEKDNIVLSSVFDEKFFNYVKTLNEKFKNTPRSEWVVLGSQSWIKGTDLAVDWCKKNNVKYNIVGNLPYEQFLEKLASAEGLVFLPPGGDTCPRIVIEAKLLGCKLVINENVQHGKEDWFSTPDLTETVDYLYAARYRFWSAIKKKIEHVPSISGYTTTYNCVTQDYPFIESITSMMGFCDEIVVVDGGSTDGTWEMLLDLSKTHPQIVTHQQKRDWTHNRSAVFDGMQKALARSMCTSEWCWQMDVDEIVHEDDYFKIRNLTKELPNNIELLALPIIEFWGGPEKVRMDIHPWKWRLSRNLPHITHGIPAQLRKFDSNGNLYAAQGTDGCDYIRNDSYQVIPHATFYTQEVDVARRAGLNQESARSQYEGWINQVVESLPTVYHYSWFNLVRKIKTYRNFWTRHWQSLYDIKTDDTAENNMFFDKPWKEVTEEEISSLALKLKNDMGGWIFHSKIDFSKKTPSVFVKKNHPKTIENWMKKNA